MDTRTTEKVVKEANRSTTLAKLEALARQLTGGALQILLCKDDKILKLLLTGEEGVLPEFCRLIRGTPEGEKRCSVCRSLVALRACYQGMTCYSCHGGISVLAAPAIKTRHADGAFVVVSSCAFADRDPVKGWKAARAHAQGLGVDLRALRRAYISLPVLTEEKEALARAIVDTAASAIHEISRYAAQIPSQEGSAPETGAQRQVGEVLGAALLEARDREFSAHRGETGSALAEVVQSIVGRYPAIPFTVGNLANAARMTPNHFSAIFHKHTGKTFTQFLTERRILLAKERLGDPTVPIAEVAVEAGFTDTNYFSRRFRKEVGMTPSDWRESLKTR